MKRILMLMACLTLLILLGTTNANAFCDEQCVYTTLPDGTDQALCLAYPENNLFNVCREINIAMFHECFVDQICWNGFPIG